MQDELLTVEEVAERLSTSEKFVRRLIADRVIPFHRLTSGANAPVRIAESDLTAFLASTRVEPMRAGDVWHSVRRAVA